MSNQDLNSQVAEAMGLKLIKAVPLQIDACGDRIWSKSWFDKDGTCIANEDKWNPSEDYNQIIKCIESKGWLYDFEKFDTGYSAIIQVNGKWYGPDIDNLQSTGEEALCKAFLAACGAVAKSATTEETA
jgi:hypothetical protein